jgi:hypothetical protein
MHYHAPSENTGFQGVGAGNSAYIFLPIILKHHRMVLKFQDVGIQTTLLIPGNDFQVMSPHAWYRKCCH